MESTEKISPNYLRDYLTLFSIAGAIAIIDQATKYLVRSNLALSDMWSPWEWLEPYARIVHWNNTGAAFGMLQGLGDIFLILAIVVALAIVYYYPQVPKEDWTLRLAMGLEFGGAVGNLIDRLTIGSVTDFVSIWRSPVFNVADLCITLGAIVLILGVWYREKMENQEAVENEPDAPIEPDRQQMPGEDPGE
jgi:signal peptidase II